MRHKHYEVIVAWAEGKEIQYRYGPEWLDWTPVDCPAFLESMKWRIKPESVPDVVREYYIRSYGLSENGLPKNLRLTFSGEDGRLIKAEVIND